MLQPKMIELEDQLNCSQKHNQPILMVIFDNKLKGEECLLCAECMENFESENMVESLISQIHKLKSDLNQLLDELISNSIDWIKSLNDIGQANTTYSFLDELDVLINGPKEKILNQESIIEQIKINNYSLCAKINIKLTNLQNQDLYQQCENTLRNIMSYPHLKSFDNSIHQQEECYALSFNGSGSLMISGSNCDIKVWNFQQETLSEITTLSGHNSAITCLIFSKKSNSFLSASYDQSICCWSQINDQEWKCSQFYQQHTNCIECLILNQAENQLISGGRDCQIKIWKVDFLKNELCYLYSLNEHENDICSLCLNESENTLVSLDTIQILIWKMDDQQNWQFDNVVTQAIQSPRSRLCFINNHQLILVTRNEVEDLICILDIQNGKNQQFQIIEELKLIKNDELGDTSLFPICYNKEKQIIIFKYKLHVYFIKISNEGTLKLLSQIDYQTSYIFGTLTNDGKYLVIWEQVGKKFDYYEIQVN
ncbi:unnamed protein product [Paramecium octaurelia]|uniref:Uncharacterized protein n=1 Tax=Paramecium octaurelia TaxID=43137 RepID=A0A8S1T7H9_PAROT|nr:unnamed protein product [Paramecium octaurelia]